MLLTRPAPPALRAVARQLWAGAPDGPTPARPGTREHVLPTGHMHLAFRLSGPALRLFRGDGDETGLTFGHAVVGGARASFHVRDISVATRSVGVLLQPGAARVLFGVPDGALADTHTPLDALWGPAAEAALARLHALDAPAAQLDLLERLLLQRVAAWTHAEIGPPPAVAMALGLLAQLDASVAQAVRASGYSHRHFVALFREHAGLTPKAYARLKRLGRVIALAAEPARGWADIAQAAGYGDQSHLSRDFCAFAGLPPQAWRRRAAPGAPRHVAL